MAGGRMDFRDRGISESRHVKAPKPIAGKKEEGGGRSFTLRHIINIIEFAAIITSGFLFLGITMIYNSHSDLFTPSRFLEFASSMTVVSLFFILLGVVVLLYNIKMIYMQERGPMAFYLVGWLLIMLVPSRLPLGILPQDPLWSPIDYFFIVVGAVFIGISAIMFFLRRRYFMLWFLGLVSFLLISAHEVYHIVSWTGNFGIFDQTLAVASLSFIFMGFIFYLIRLLSDYMLVKRLPKINDLINRARAERKDGKTEDAVMHLKEAIHLYPWNFVAWNNLGNVYMDMEDETRAEKCYKRALLINPEYEFSLNNLGVLRRKQARFREAIRFLEKAVNLRPDYEVARENLELAQKGVK